MRGLQGVDPLLIGLGAGGSSAWSAASWDLVTSIRICEAVRSMPVALLGDGPALVDGVVDAAAHGQQLLAHGALRRAGHQLAVAGLGLERARSPAGATARRR